MGSLFGQLCEAALALACIAKHSQAPAGSQLHSSFFLGAHCAFVEMRSPNPKTSRAKATYLTQNPIFGICPSDRNRCSKSFWSLGFGLLVRFIHQRQPCAPIEDRDCRTYLVFAVVLKRRGGPVLATTSGLGRAEQLAGSIA